MEIIDELRKDIQTLSKQIEAIGNQVKEVKTASEKPTSINLDTKKVAETLAPHLSNATEKESAKREQFLKELQTQIDRIPKNVEYGLSFSTRALIYSVVGTIILSAGIMYYFMQQHNTEQLKEQAKQIIYLQYEVNYLREKAPKAAAQFDKKVGN